MSVAVNLVGTAVIAVQTILAVGALLYLTQKIGIYQVTEIRQLETIKDYLTEFADEISFSVAFVATTASLYFSEILTLEPCPFCWYQRILMYPLVVILGTSIFLRKSSRDFVIPLTMIGAAISVYHIAVQVIGESIATGCGESGVSCSVIYIQYAGYVTIPVMALTAFLAIFLLQWKFRE